MESPWSTKIIDLLPLKQNDKFLLKCWIWTDRLMWIAATAAIFSFAVLYFK